MTQHHSRISIPDAAENHPATFRQWRSAFLDEFEKQIPSHRTAPPVGEVMFRFDELDHTRAQDSQKTIEATLSTGMRGIRRTLRQGSYLEELEVSPESVRLGRSDNMSGLPLLWAHDWHAHIGICENVRVHGGALRARLRFGDSPLALEKWADVKNGTLRGISVGYYVHRYETSEDEDGVPIYRAVDWEPAEASIVTIPFDHKAVTARGAVLGYAKSDIEPVALLREKEKLVREVDVLAISALPETDADVPESVTAAMDNVRDLLMSAATSDDMKAVREAMRDASEQIETWSEQEHTSSVRDIDQMNGVKTMNDFSLTRALSARIDPNAAARAAHELQVSDELTQRSDVVARGVMVPGEVVFHRAFDYATESGNAVNTDRMTSAFVDGLRSNLVAGELGVTFMDGLRGNVEIPKLSSDVSTNWLAADGADTITESQPALTKIEMSPKFVGGRTIISRRMLVQSDPAAERIVRDSLGNMLAQAVDNVILNGTGASNQPTGVLGSGITPTLYANGGTPSFGQIVDMEGTITSANAGKMGGLVYLMHPTMAAQLKQTDIGTDTGEMIWSSSSPGVGMVNGYRAMTTTLVPADTIILGDWRDVLVGTWSGVDVIVDETTRSQYLDVIVTAYLSIDVALRHSESFAVLSETP